MDEVMVAQHCECINASKLYTERWVRWYVLCYVYFITMETQWAREADAGNSEVEGAGKAKMPFTVFIEKNPPIRDPCSSNPCCKRVKCMYIQIMSL